MKKISSYSSYRHYLRDFLNSKKESLSGFSQASFAKKSGFSPSALVMIIEGKRNLTIGKIFDLAQTMKLDSQDHDYWESLVHFEQAKSENEKNFYQKRLRKEKRQRKLNAIETGDRQLINDWRTSIILCYLLDLRAHEKSGELNIARIGKALGLKKSDVEEKLRKLEESGILEKAGDGEVHIAFEKMGRLIARQQYLAKVIDVSKDKMKTRFQDPNSYFEGHTFSVSESGIREFKAEYKKLVEKYMAKKLEPNKNLRIAQAYTSIFPVL